MMASKRDKEQQSAVNLGTMGKDLAELILNNAIEGFWDWDMRADRAFLSPRYCELLGYAAADTIFNSSFFQSIIHPDDVGGVSNVLREYLEGKRDRSVLEYRVVRKDGTHVWLREQARVVEYGEDGNPVRMVGSVIDITARKRVELELQSSHELLHYFTEQVPGALFQTRLSPDGHFSTPYASRAVKDIYGIPPEMIARDASVIFETFHPDDRDGIMASIQESARTLQPWEHEYRILKTGHGIKWLRGHAIPMRLEDGSTLWHGLITDITERKMMEKRLVESEERYRRVFEVESDAIFLVSRATGRFVDANKAATEIYGYSREELLGMVFTDVSAEPDKSRLFVESGRTHVPLRWHRRKDGSVFPVEISGGYFDVQGDSIHVAAIRDISERKQAERLLEEARVLLERQVQERTASLSRANEQLNQEIEERRWAERELLDHQRKLEELGFELSIAEERERGRIAGELHDEVGQCLILCKIKANSLAASDPRPDQQGTIAELESLLDKSIQDIRSLTFQLRPPLLALAGLEAAVQWLGEELKLHYGLQVDCYDDLQPKPLGYELRAYLFQAIRELLLNVVRHAGTNRANVRLQREGGNIAITVMDNGVGFDTTANLVGKGRAGGFGIFSVQQRIEYLGGRFMIYSQPGKGSRVTIVVPLELPGEQ